MKANLKDYRVALKGVLVLGVVLFIIVWLTGIFLPTLNTSPEKATRIVCASHLKVLGLALKQYAADYGGAYPPYDGIRGLRMLIDLEYLAESEIECFTCREEEARKEDEDSFLGASFHKLVPPLTEEKLGFVYKGGLSEKDSPDSALCWSKPRNHSNFGNILFVDGHVKGYAGADWMDNVKYGAKQKTSSNR